METKNLVDLPASSSSSYKCENNDVQNSCCGPSEVDSPPGNSKLKESKLVGKILGSEGEAGDKNSKILLGTDIDKCLVDDPSILQVGNGLTETIVENLNCVISGVHTENGSIDVKDGSPINNLKRDGSPGSSYKIDGSSTSSVKRARLTVDERQSSVHVTFNSLTRASKQKLQELLQQWSEWDAHYCSLSHDSTDALESGEETHFPALHVGSDKRSAVAFWIDNQTKNQHNKEFIPLDSNSIPLYDRGFSLGLASADGSTNLDRSLEIVDASRCFNCGSYSHSLKECPKPRDNTAVNNARKKHKSRRSQKASSRNPTRYYQNSPGGKYDGLRPGVLGAETRQLLGLGELDPPPWLNRMREIGYPPGYLDPEGEDQPSGIMIFADEEQKEEKEDGEILEIDNPEPPLKMSVEFPGINAAIPENADERRWASRPSNFDQSRNRSHRRFHHSSESVGTGRYQEQRRFTDYRDEGPPGTSNYPQRHGGYDSSYTPYSSRGNIPVPRSPSLRSPLDRGRWSPSVHEASPSHGSYSPALYTPSRLLSPQRYDSSSSENRDRDIWNDFNPNSSSHHNDHHDSSRRHSRR